MGRRFIWITLCLWAVALAPAWAQTGGLRVLVKDSEDNPLPQATVVLSNAVGHVSPTALATDEQGFASFPVLRTGGGYKIEVAHPGFATVRLTDIKVHVNNVLQIPVVLSPGTEERIEVTATSDVVQLDQTQSSTRFTDEFIRDLPIAGRQYQNILTLAPGVEDADGDGNPTVHGSRSRDFKAEVSGISNVDPLTGQWMSRVNPNSIEELEVIPAGAGVEFGRAQGGFARIIQKQGSNEFEGVFDLLWRSSSLDTTIGNSNVEDPKYTATQGGFQLSGPILKDKVWYRLSHEWTEREDPIVTDGGTEVATTSAATHADQITWQVSPRNKLAFSFQSDPLEIDNFGVSRLVAAEASQRREFEGQTYSVTWSSPYSSRIFVESKIAWQDLNTSISPTTTGVPNDCVIGIEALENAPCLVLGSAVTTGSAARDLDDHRQRFTLRSDVTVFAGRVLGASHQVKAGIIVENERYFRTLTQRPTTRLDYVQPFEMEDGMLTEPGLFLEATIAVPQTTDVRATGTAWALYAEDQIKPLNNLVLTVGLRYDREEINSEGVRVFDPRVEQATYFDLVNNGVIPQVAFQRSFTAPENVVDLARQLALILDVNPEDAAEFAKIKNGFSPIVVESSFWKGTREIENLRLRNNNPAPYLGVSWDPWNNGKTKFAAVASRHYNNIPLGVPLIGLEPLETDLTYRVDPLFRRLEDPFTGVELGLSTTMVDPDLKTPYQDELYLSFEREVARETAVKLSYIKRQYRDQLQDIDINRFTGDFGACREASATFPNPIEPLLPQESAFAPGDGIVDDCQGTAIAAPGSDAFSSTIFLQTPDYIDDLYIANPGWVDVLLLGNFNSSDYDAWVLELIRRQYRGWEMQFNYTFSESVGNGEDYLQEFGNDNSLIEDEFGFSSDHRRHVAKLTAATVTAAGVRLGGSLSWQSGLPYSVITEELSFDAVPIPYQNVGAGTAARSRQIYDTGQRNDQRNIPFWNLDLKVAKEFSIARKVRFQLSAEVFNALDDQTYTIYNPAFGLGRRLNGENEGFFRQGRRWQLGLRLAF